MNAREALLHGWFQEDPKPTLKFVVLVSGFIRLYDSHPCSVFQQQLNTPPQLPPHRRITQDEAPSMMPAQATHAQHLPAQFTQQQHLQGQTHGSVTSFASLSAGQGGHSRKKTRLG